MTPHRRTAAMVDDLARAMGTGPWPLADVLGHGWSVAQVRRAMDAGRLTRPHRGVVALPEPSGPSGRADSEIRRIRAAMLVTGGNPVVSHGSAATLQELWSPDASSDLVHLTVAGEPDRLDHGMRIHGSRLPAQFVTTHTGLRVTTPARTAIDLGRSRSLPDALVALDGAARHLAIVAHGASESALRDVQGRAAVTEAAVADLWEAYESVRTWPGTVVLRRALALVDPASESPFESRSRAWIALAGLPTPVVAYPVRGASGALYYADFAWAEQRVLGESDGIGKYGLEPESVRASLRRERERQRDLEDAGWTVVRWDSGESRRTVLARLRRALACGPRVTGASARKSALN